jgi:hypothetical protein
MDNVATASIKAFGSKPPEAGFVPPEDPILEIPLSDLQGLLSEMISTYNTMAEAVQDAGILRGRELAKLTTKANDSLMAARSPIEKGLLLCAFLRQLLARLRDSMKAQPRQAGKVVQVCSKIMARAIQLIDHVKSFGAGQERDISMDSGQARMLFAGKEGEEVSRRDAIRAMKRAERLWPALLCCHRPGDGRRTMRLVARKEDIPFAPEVDYRSYWQRCGKSIGLSL